MSVGWCGLRKSEWFERGMMQDWRDFESVDREDIERLWW